jgi:hypothetical protein
MKTITDEDLADLYEAVRGLTTVEFNLEEIESLQRAMLEILDDVKRFDPSNRKVMLELWGDGMKAELDAIRAAAGDENPIKLIKAAKKLPRTADGFPIAPKMKLWAVQWDDVYSFVVEAVRADEIEDKMGRTLKPEWCFSTESAAMKKV